MNFQLIKPGELTNCTRLQSWAIEGVLGKASLVNLYGGSGSYTTFLGLDWALSIATGTPWLGHQVTQSPVFYISGDSPNGLGQRIKAWENARGMTLEGQPFYVSSHAAQILHPDSAHQIASILQNLRREHGLPAALFIDSLARNFGPGNENNVADMRRFIDTLQWVAGDGALRVVLHHTGWASKERARGNSCLSAAVNTEYRIEKNSEGVGMKAFLFQTQTNGVPGWDHPLVLKLEKVPVIDDDQGRLYSLAITEGTPVAV